MRNCRHYLSVRIAACVLSVIQPPPPMRMLHSSQWTRSTPLLPLSPPRSPGIRETYSPGPHSMSVVGNILTRPGDADVHESPRACLPPSTATKISTRSRTSSPCRAYSRPLSSATSSSMSSICRPSCSLSTPASRTWSTDGSHGNGSCKPWWER